MIVPDFIYKKAEWEDLPTQANSNYPKIVIEDTGARVVNSGSVTLTTGDKFFLQPPDSNFGTVYNYLTYSNKDGAYVIRYVNSGEPWSSPTSSNGQQLSFTYGTSMPFTGVTQLDYLANVVSDFWFSAGSTVVTTDGTHIFIFSNLNNSSPVYALNLDGTIAWKRTLPTSVISVFSIKDGVFYIDTSVTNTPNSGDMAMNLVKLNTTDGTDHYTMNVTTLPSGTTIDENTRSMFYYFADGTIILYANTIGHFAVDVVNKLVTNLTSSSTSDLLAIV